MTADARAALASLVAALERHLEASASRRGENDPTVLAAYQDLADAFETYDDALLDAYGEVTPLEVYADEDAEDEDAESLGDGDGSDDDSDDDGDDPDDSEDAAAERDDDPPGRYVGLDDDEFEVEQRMR